MQIRPLDAFADLPQTITGMDGSIYASANLVFDTSDYSFTYNDPNTGLSTNVTDNITRADKLNFPGFDPVVDNNRLSYYVAGHQATVNAAGISPLAPLPTSTASLFATNLGNTITNPTSNSTIQKLLTYGAIGLGAYLVIGLIINRRR